MKRLQDKKNRTIKKDRKTARQKKEKLNKLKTTKTLSKEKFDAVVLGVVYNEFLELDITAL
jgi:hypothetical protein